MRKLRVMFLFVPVLIMVACSGGNTPEDVAEKFNKAVYSANFEGAKALCTEDSKQAVDFVAALVSENVEQMKKSDVKYEIQQVKISEDGKSADVEGIVLGSLDFETNQVKDSVGSKLHLIKVNDKWLVDYKLK